MNWAEIKLRHEAFKISAFPESGMPKTLAGRVEFIHYLLNFPVVDEETGEVEYVQLISTEAAKKMLDAPIGPADKP